MSRRDRPEPWQMAVVVAIAAASIAFVVLVTVGVLRDGVGTGNPFDYWRAIWREVTDAGNWVVIGWSAVAGAVLTLVVEAIAYGRRRWRGARPSAPRAGRD